MTDQVAIVREVLSTLTTGPGGDLGVNALAALGALVAERDEARRELSKWESHNLFHDRMVAAEAEVARLRERYDEAVAHLHGIVEADKQDAKMGHPNPGDSCISIYISLVLMEWLETRAALDPKDDA